MATEIGIIKGLMGTVTATAADGSQRTLQVGDKLFANEIVRQALQARLKLNLLMVASWISAETHKQCLIMKSLIQN